QQAVSLRMLRPLTPHEVILARDKASAGADAAGVVELLHKGGDRPAKTATDLGALHLLWAVPAGGSARGLTGPLAASAELAIALDRPRLLHLLTRSVRWPHPEARAAENPGRAGNP